jgi:DNA-binding CsgD family transcriptional regulator
MLDMVALTPRERQILPFLAKGMRNKEIAVELDVAEATVKLHIKSIFSKTGLHTRAAVSGAVAGTAAGTFDLAALVRRVAPDVVRIAAAEQAGHITPPEAQKLIEGLVAAGA